MKKLLITLLIVAVIGISAFLVLNSSSTGNVVQDEYGENGIKEFYITGKNFKFVVNEVDNPDIKVKEGDIVKIEFSSTQGFHDFVIDELNAATEKVRPENGITSIEFIASKKGTFEYYCSVGEHRVNGMKGKFIVE